MKKILFVDDDQNILLGLKRTLRSMRREWDMEFASSGQEALDIMAKSSFDVIVSDMRMPKMNGVELLETVMERYPDTIRIILSGHSDQEMILRSIKSTHQFLIKPSNTVTLKFTIERACGFRELLRDKMLRRIIGSAEDLPTLPKLYSMIMKEIQSPDVCLKNMGDIVSRDISMSAKLLKVVNSAFFGLPQRINDPQQAAVYLGLDTLRALVLAIEVFSSDMKDQELIASSLEDIWRHSLDVGRVAKEIAYSLSGDKKIAEEAMVGGMLHDIGKLILLRIPDKYKEIQALNEDIGCGILAAENEVLKTSHAELGAYLLCLWGISEDIVTVIAYHHNPSRLIGDASDLPDEPFEENSEKIKSTGRSDLTLPSDKIDLTGLTVLTAVHVANSLINQKECSSGTTDFKYIDMRYLRALNLVDKLPEWVACYEKIRRRESENG